MKIALANNLYFPFNRGGAESVLKKQISALKASGHEVFLISCKARNQAAPDNQDLKIYHIDSDYPRLAEFSSIRRLLWHLRDVFSFTTSRKIEAILKAEKPDLFISHNIMGLGLRLPCVLRKLKIKHEHYLHDIQLLYPSGLMMLGREKIVDSLGAKLYQVFTRSFFASPSKIISPSYWLLGQHRQRGFFHDSETEIKNFNGPDIKAAPANKQKPYTKFLFVGQIESHKGVIILIKSFLGALEVKPNLNLSIIGDGALMAQAKEAAAGCGRIKFLGRLETAQVASQMSSHDCLVIPSLCYENAPMTINEAHAASLPVLAAQIGGIPEMVNENDRLFKAGDYLDLKNKILEE